MTKLSLKKNNFNPALELNQKNTRFSEIYKVGVKYPKKVNMPKKQNTLTEYQSQYKAKQQIKNFYGNLSENTLKNIRNVASSNSTPLICEIEKRLDVVVFRLGFARSIFEARALIKGGFISVDEKIVKGNYGSFSKILKVGNKITIQTTEKAYLARIKHLRLNIFKLPTHLIVTQILDKPSETALNISLYDNSSLSADIWSTQNKISLDGYFIKEPIEAEVYLPYNYPINKLH